MRRLIAGLLGLAVLGVAESAPGQFSTDQRLDLLERRIATVTDLTLRLDAVQRENRLLRGEIKTLQHRIEQLNRKQRDIYLDIDQRLSDMATAQPNTVSPAAGSVTPSEPATVIAQSDQPIVPAPVVDRTTAQSASANPVIGNPASITPVSANTVSVANPASVPAAEKTAPNPATYDQAKLQSDYKVAYGLLSPSQRRYDEAATAFLAFLENYPGSRLASNAQYWLAESYYVSQKNDLALEAFSKVVSDYPSSPKVAGALYKIGRLQGVKGNKEAARKALSQVIDEYPRSPAAGLAKDYLAKL